MSNFISTFQERFSEWVTALGQHLQLSLLTLLVAIFLTIPLAVYLNGHKKAATWVLQVAGIFQTIPSMALLGLFIPFMGIGTLPALTALVIYAIFPILENTITALNGIDLSLEEAGIAFGMTKWERLKKFEIPLATPFCTSAGVVKPNFGKTDFLYQALKKGDIDIYPEFSGTVTESLLQSSPQIGHDPEKVYEVARDGIAKQDQLAFLKPMAYQNTYAIAVPKKIAQEYGLKTISDLKKVEGQLKAGFTLEFNDREDGNKGLQSVYGLNLNVATMEPALRYQAIQSGDIQITDAYSTDAEIARYDLVVLEDDKQLFPPYQGAPLMKEELLKKHPELEAVLNKLAGKITESQMSQMNYQVGVEGHSAEEVARDFLLQEGILQK